jgi:membrane protease YdiL (CAAX protease family)
VTSFFSPIRLPVATRFATIARLAITLTALYIVPVLALSTGLIAAKWRFHVLIAMCAVALLLASVRRHPIMETDGDMPGVSALMKWSIGPSLLLIAAIMISGVGGRFAVAEGLPFYLFFFFVAAPAQEFLYRKFLFAELSTAKMPASVTILLSAGLFAFMHIIYKDALTLGLTFALGIVWGFVFTRTRSFCTVALSHAILGVGAIGLGVI